VSGILRQGVPVGGAYAVTGTLPTLDDVLSFVDGSGQYEHGYYRYVPHPHLRRLAARLQEALGCRNCRLAESPEIALVELLLCLCPPGEPRRILVLAEPGVPVPVRDPGFLPACSRTDVAVLVPDVRSPGVGDFTRNDLLVLVRADGDPHPFADLAGRAAHAGATVISYQCVRDTTRVSVIPSRFHVVGLHTEPPRGLTAGISAGAVLSDADKVMGRLAEQMRRRGPVLSCRVAESFAPAGTAAPKAGSAEAAGLPAASPSAAEVLRSWEGGTEIFLYASGMSAVTRVLDVLRVPGKTQVVAIGHLFNDTFTGLRTAPRLPGEEPNVFLGVDELDRLDGAIGGQTAAIVTETITNPLGDVPDLALLARVARERGVPLVVDNTLATPLNCTPLSLGADVVVHSTTKHLNGGNDHGGGAVVVRDSRIAGLLAERRSLWNDAMAPPEAAVLRRSILTLPARMARFSANALRVASMLAGHPAVGRLWFNGLSSHRSHATARRLLAGHGSVISFVLSRETRDALRLFYDSPLAGILKAPGLGSNVTQICPYTLLTHARDSDETLASYGLPRHLLRISVGCEEDIGPVLTSLGEALERSCGASGPAPTQ
jgi:cystathionine beta-lyase/cystathionine gamma-synthase